MNFIEQRLRAAGKYVEDYFKPTPNVRTRDYIREVPGAVWKVGKQLPQDMARFGMSAAEVPYNFATGGKTTGYHNFPVLGKINSFQDESKNRINMGQPLWKAAGIPMAEAASFYPGAKAAKIGANEFMMDRYFKNVVNNIAPIEREEIDTLSRNLASKYNGFVSDNVPIKNIQRAKIKARSEKNRNYRQVDDFARNTIIVPKLNVENAATDLGMMGGKLKVIKPGMDPYGYTGANYKYSPYSEIQVNSPEMIFAKERPEDARKILGNVMFDQLASKYGQGGLGHKFYEEGRNIEGSLLKFLKQKELARIQALSREFYGRFQ